MLGLFIRPLSTAIGLAFVALPYAAHADHMKVRIHNDTGVSLYGFTSTNSGAKNWGSDVLGNSTLPSGSSMVLNFDNAKGYCLFDFKAVFEDGDVLERGGVNVCEITDFTYE